MSDMNRRDFVVAAMAASSALRLPARGVWPGSLQDPPAGCPALPTGGTLFVPGSDTRPVVLRKAVSALSAAEKTTLATAFAKLRALPATDNRRWLLQADLHALYCGQCFGTTINIHGSWSFFPWHRAYLYYYERILGSLVGDINHFRLPYWDWENQRTLPGAYITPSGAGNALYDALRDGGMAGGGPLPPADGTQARINTLNALTDFDSFGGTGGVGGSMEGDPHGIVHSDVGEPTLVAHDMGNLGFAARDPIFFAHHGNIDKLWSRWNDLAHTPGVPAGEYQNPTDPAFLNLRWSFYDETQAVVSISAGDVLDHEKDLRYTYTKPRFLRPFRLIAWPVNLICCRPGPDPGPYLQFTPAIRDSLRTATLAQSTMLLVLHGVPVPANAAGVFDVVAVRGDRRTTVGSIGIVAHADTTHVEKPNLLTLTFDITKALGDLTAAENPATLQVVRRTAKGARGATAPAATFQLRAEKAEIRAARAGQ